MNKETPIILSKSVKGKIGCTLPKTDVPEYKLSDYMIDLRRSIFQSDMNGDVTTVRQNLQISYVEKLLSIVGSKSKYDNISKSTAHYNLNWLSNNLNINTGDLASRQHKGYILHIINDVLNTD